MVKLQDDISLSIVKTQRLLRLLLRKETTEVSVNLFLRDSRQIFS